MESFVGEIKAIGGKAAPEGWHLCDGALLSTSAYPVLFRLIGTTYGGDGQGSFALPDLRGRVQIGSGVAPDLHLRSRGARGGVEKVALTIDELPTHSHTLYVMNKPASTSSPIGAMPATPAGDSRFFQGPGSEGPDVTLASATLQPAGGGAAHTNMMPGLVVTYAIALEGKDPAPQDGGGEKEA